jgi:hypothetical protein
MICWRCRSNSTWVKVFFWINTENFLLLKQIRILSIFFYFFVKNAYLTPKITHQIYINLENCLDHCQKHWNELKILETFTHDSINTGSSLPYISDVMTRKRRNMNGIDMIRNNHILLKEIKCAWNEHIHLQVTKTKKAPFLACWGLLFLCWNFDRITS